MAKGTEYKVTVYLSDEVSKQEEFDIGENILKSLMHTVNTAGLTTENEETAYTKTIEVEFDDGLITGDINSGNIETA